MVSWKFFIDVIFPAALWHLASTQTLTEMSTRSMSWGGGERRPVQRADNLTTSLPIGMKYITLEKVLFIRCMFGLFYFVVMEECYFLGIPATRGTTVIT